MSEIFAPGSIAGPPATFMGPHNSGTSYSIGTAVSSNGSSYVSLVNSNMGNAPSTSPTQWALLAAGGANGLNGTNGTPGAAGSASAVSWLAGAILPKFVGRNLLDVGQVTGAQVNSSDGTLTPGGPSTATGLIYCPGATSMISNMRINANNWGGGICFYDANGTFISAFAGTYSDYAAFALPGTQAYVRFGYVPSWMAAGFDVSSGMIYASTTGTATLPGTYQQGGMATVAAMVAGDTAVTTSLVSSTHLLLESTTSGPAFCERNAFDFTRVIPGTSVAPNGTLFSNAGHSSAMVYAPKSTSFVTNIPINIDQYGGQGFCTYDANGNFLEDLTASLLLQSLGANSLIAAGTAYALPGNQAYVKFTWVGNNGFGSDGHACTVASAVFYSGTVSSPPPALTVLNQSKPFLGNAPVTVKTATQLGAAPNFGTDCSSILNAFLATASATNPIKLILDGNFSIYSSLVISPCGYTTIEGIGWGSGLTMYAGYSSISIGSQGQGAYNVTPPPRTATNIALRNFTILQSGASGIAMMLACCSNVIVENVNFPKAGLDMDFMLTITNANQVFVRGCAFASTGAGHDGVHIDGLCEDITVSDCYFATGDDAIALNAPEGYGGDISRVTVTNCRFNGSMTAMRIYTSLDAAAMPTNNTHKVRNVVMSNCTGWVTNQCFNLGITNSGLSSTSNADQIQDLSVSNCTFAANLGLALLLAPIGSLNFSDVRFIPLTTAPLLTCLFSSVGEIGLRNVRILRNSDGNAAPASIVYVYNNVLLDRITLSNFAVIDEEGSSYAPIPALLDMAGGTISTLRLEGVDMTHITALASSNGWEGLTTLRGGGVIGTGAQVPDSVMANNSLYLSSTAGGAPSIKVGGAVKRLSFD